MLVCSEAVSPICGSDGVTYGNECLLCAYNVYVQCEDSVGTSGSTAQSSWQHHCSAVIALSHVTCVNSFKMSLGTTAQRSGRALVTVSFLCLGNLFRFFLLCLKEQPGDESTSHHSKRMEMLCSELPKMILKLPRVLHPCQLLSWLGRVALPSQI